MKKQPKKIVVTAVISVASVASLVPVMVELQPNVSEIPKDAAAIIEYLDEQGVIHKAIFLPPLVSTDSTVAPIF